MEKAYQKTKNFDKLSFLYLSTGSSDKLAKMYKIAQSRGDPMSRFHNALYAGDIENRISVLRDVGMCACGHPFPHAMRISFFDGAYVFYADPLAYLTANTNGLAELAAEILEEAGLTEADIDDVPDFGQSTLRPPPVVTPLGDLNWPLLSKGESFFDRALANGNLDGDVDGLGAGGAGYVNGIGGGAAANAALDDWARDEEIGEEANLDPEEGGWDLDADTGAAQVAEGAEGEKEEEVELDGGAGASAGVKETELWVRNSPFPADHVAAGSFESAMQVSRLQLLDHP